MINSVTKYLLVLALIFNSFCAVSQEAKTSENLSDFSIVNPSVYYTSFEMLDAEVEIQEFSLISESDLPSSLKEILTSGTEREKAQLLDFMTYHNDVLIPKLNNAVEKRIYELKNPKKFRQRSLVEIEVNKHQQSRFVLVSQFDLEALMFNNQSDGISTVLNKTYSDFNNAYGSEIKLKGTFYLYDRQEKIHFAPKDSFDDLLVFLDDFYRKLENKSESKLTESYLVHVHKSLDKSIRRQNEAEKIKKRNGLILGGVLAGGIVSFRIWKTYVLFRVWN